MSGTADPGYAVVTVSVRGPSHRRSGQPNQDAVAADEAAVPPFVVAVADGHGSERSFRSDRGSRAAVEIAVETLSDLAREGLTAAVERGPARVVERWRAAVLADAAADPPESDLSEGELLRAYGSTLLAVVVAEDGLGYLQLGDGDVLEVASDGTVRRGTPAEGGVDSSETTSLCLDDAAALFRSRLVAESPALVLLATDGYSNSFVDEDSFLRVGSDLLGAIRDVGVDEVRQLLPQWLEETTTEGSGDDVTVGLVYRPLGAHAAVSTTPGRPWSLIALVVGAVVMAALFVVLFVLGGDTVDPAPDPTVTPTSGPTQTSPSPGTPTVAPTSGDGSPSAAPIQRP